MVRTASAARTPTRVPNKTQSMNRFMNTHALPELSDRLTQLAGNQSGIRSVITTEVRESEIQNRDVLDFISSDQTLDRYDEIITASGWKLENYQRNPVFQNSHQYEDVIHTLGRAIITEVRAGKLYQQIQFAT